MNRIRRSRARTRPPGTLEPRANQPTGPAAPRASRSGRGGFAGRFIQDLAAAARVAVGQNWPAPATANPRQHTVITPGPQPRTVQLCIHCRHNPAGFWVSRTGGQTVRRPWCLSCCQELDRDRCDVIPFDS